jgi:hypothetical protein
MSPEPPVDKSGTGSQTTGTVSGLQPGNVQPGNTQPGNQSPLGVTTLPTDKPLVPVAADEKETVEPVAVGKGGKAFDITNPPNGPVSDRVGLDSEGAIIVDFNNHAGQNLIWVPHTETGLVSKIDTTKRVELARYRVGAIDPSRTSVAPNGDAYVASREGVGLTKISALGKNCPDTNKDGVITTSTGPDNVLEWGKDDCVLWFTDIHPLQPEEDDEMIRGAAVQVVPGRLVTKKSASGETTTSWVPPKEYVWVGGTQAQKLYKLDGDTGQAIVNMKSPLDVYGLAMDGRDRMEMGGPYLWISGGHGGHNIGHIDTSRCVDTASCLSEPICQVTCSENDCKNTCDNAIRAHYLLEPANAYGITVDCKQRIWLGSRSKLPVSDVKRFDPFAPQNKRLKLVSGTPITHGIAADAAGFVWGAYADKDIVYKINGETLKTVNLSVPSKGLGVDRTGVIWSIPNNGRNELHIIEPTKDLSGADRITRGILKVTGTPYVYSDMTGQQLLLASNNPGYYRQIFDPCTPGGTETTVWKTIDWDTELPSGTHVVVNFRFSSTRAGLGTATWTTIDLTNANAVGSNEIESLVQGAGESAYVEMEARLFPATGGTANDACSTTSATGATPRVKKLSVNKVCVPKPIPKIIL